MHTLWSVLALSLRHAGVYVFLRKEETAWLRADQGSADDGISSHSVPFQPCSAHSHGCTSTQPLNVIGCELMQKCIPICFLPTE